MATTDRGRVTAFLSRERNGVKLPPRIVEALVVYIVDLNDMGVDDVSDVNESFLELLIFQETGLRVRTSTPEGFGREPPGGARAFGSISI